MSRRASLTVLGAGALAASTSGGCFLLPFMAVPRGGADAIAAMAAAPPDTTPSIGRGPALAGTAALGTLLVAMGARRATRPACRAMAGKSAPEGRSTELPAREARGGAFDASTQPGALAPMGFWDPVGFCNGINEDDFLKLRGIELKHGRCAMLALAGFLGQHFWKFPGFEDVPSGVQAATTYPGSAGLGVLFLISGFFELSILPELEAGNAPGNFGDPLRIVSNQLVGGYDEDWRNKELNNGRLAMFGAIGTMVAGWYTGLDAFEQWGAARGVAIEFIKTTLPYSP